MHLATELTSHISLKTDGEEETGEDFAKFFPKLIWAVRDHHLELNVDGQKISANQYLKNCLAGGQKPAGDSVQRPPRNHQSVLSKQAVLRVAFPLRVWTT